MKMFGLTDKPPFKDLLQHDLKIVQLPLFCQFFVFARQSAMLSVEETARLLRVRSEIIRSIENGQIWGYVNKIDLFAAEAIFGLQKGSLKKVLKATLLVKK